MDSHLSPSRGQAFRGNDEPVSNCTAVILAGGESRRMGQDKATVMLHHETLLGRAIHNMQSLFDHLLISVREPRSRLSVLQLCDRDTGKGPMAGIASALEYVETGWVFAIACDMPFVSGSLIRAMSSRRCDVDVVVAHMHGHLQPLAAFYSTACLPQMREQIEAGNRSLKRLIGDLDSCIISEDECRSYDPSALSFFDLDTKSDVVQAESVLDTRGK